MPVNNKLSVKVNNKYVEGIDTNALVTNYNKSFATFTHQMKITISNIKFICPVYQVA